MSAALGSRMYSASRYLAPLARRTIAGHAIRSFQTVTPTHLWAVRFAPLASRSSSVVGRSFQQHRFASSLAVGDVYDVVVPTMGDSITEGTIVTWVKQPGEYVAPDEVYCVVETDKVTVDINATQGGGILKEIMAEEGDNVEVGAVFAKFEYTEPPAGGAPVAKDDSPPTPPAPPAAPAASTPPAPAAAPTPPASAPPAMKPSPAPSAPAAAASSEGDRTEKRVKMTRMRKRIAERLTESQETAVMLTTFNEVDMSKLMALRKKYKDQFEKVHGVKLGFMSAFVRAATVALQEVPAVNAIIDGDHIVFRDYVDISVAVSSPRGLVVPVLRDTQKMSFADVEREIGILGAKARNDTITLEEMTGGTFSVTNGGVFGSLMSTPIINMPQSAILGMHGIKERPVVVDGEIVARPMMYIALTYDHRLIDGRESVTFLKSIKEKVEDPERFLLGL